MIDLDLLHYLPDISPEAYETLVLLARGYDNHEVANFRNVKVCTIITLMRNTNKKIGTKDTKQLIDLAQRLCVI